jgi:hypothetical protein
VRSGDGSFLPVYTAETHHTTIEKQQNTHQYKGNQEKNATPQQTAIRPTHRKIKTKAISQPAPLDGQPTFKANGI